MNFEEAASALRHGSHSAQLRAARALGRMHDRKALKPLVDALETTDSSVLEVIVLALGELGERGAREPLAGVLRNPDPWVRIRAAAALALLGDSRGEPVLAAALTSSDTDQPLAVVGPLARLGRSGEAALIEAFNEPDQPAPVREAIVAAIGERDSDAARELLDQACRDPNRFVRRAARRALST